MFQQITVLQSAEVPAAELMHKTNSPNTGTKYRGQPDCCRQVSALKEFPTGALNHQVRGSNVALNTYFVV